MIIAPGEPMRPARVYDSNAQVLAMRAGAGRRAKRLGITHDDVAALRERLGRPRKADIVLLSGGTSKAGDLSPGWWLNCRP